MPQIYWGAQAIVNRLGLRDKTKIRTYILRDGLPAFLRQEPRNPLRKSYYSDETLISAWLMAKAIDYRNELKAQAEQETASKADRLAIKGKKSATRAFSRNHVA